MILIYKLFYEQNSKEVLIVNISKNKLLKSIVIILFCLLPVNNYFIPYHLILVIYIFFNNQE